jgi:hypothetical protein
MWSRSALHAELLIPENLIVNSIIRQQNVTRKSHYQLVQKDSTGFSGTDLETVLAST